MWPHLLHLRLSAARLPARLPARRLASSAPHPTTLLHIAFEDDVEQSHTTAVAPRKTLLAALLEADISDVWEGGACGGSCMCSTCRVVLTPEVLAALPAMDYDEEDMLSTAALQEHDGDAAAQEQYIETSRLSCQLQMTAAAEALAQPGAVISIPDCTPPNMLEIPLWLRKR